MKYGYVRGHIERGYIMPQRHEVDECPKNESLR